VAAIALDHVRKGYPGAARLAVADLSIEIADGERLVIVGPSGSGKSTVLRLVAGLDAPTAGRVRIDDVDVTDVPPESRDLAMVFQSYALYPHMDVRANLSFGLRMRGIGRADTEARVLAVAHSLGLGPLLDRKPAALSGGERQRVALGRAIVRHPKAFLFDEPLSNLDPRLRGNTRAELVALHQRLNATMVYVTHDQEEAMTLGQRIAVMHEGRLEQIATPQDLYERPANRFVATFIGSPPMNVLEGTGALAAAAGRIGERIARDRLSVGIRPHDVSLASPGDGALDGAVEVVEPLGHVTIVHVRTADEAGILAVMPGAPGVRPGDQVGLRFASDRCHIFAPDGRRLDA
jgi:multiple sugar transport system ATP-binding protein